VQITLQRTWDRRLGASVSGMAALGIAGLVLFRRMGLRMP